MADIFDDLMKDAANGVVKPAAEPEGDPIFDGLMDEAKRAEDRQRTVSILRAQAGDPDAYGETKMLATNFGVDLEFATRNREKLEKFQGFTDAKRMFDNNGKLASFFVKDDNSSAIKMDELQALDGLSWLYQPVVETAKGVAGGAVSVTGQSTQGAGGQYLSYIIGSATPSQREIMDRIDAGERIGPLDVAPDDVTFTARYNDLPLAIRRSMRANATDDIRTTGAYKAGAAMREWSADQFAAAKGYEDSWTRTISEAVGSTLPFIAASLAGAPGAGMVVGSFASAGEALDRAVQAGATKEQILETIKLGGLPGLTEQLPIETLFEKIPLPYIGRFGDAVGKVLSQALAEGGQEAVQQAAQNLIARYVYKPEQDISEGVVEAATIGGIVGGGFKTAYETTRLGLDARRAAKAQVDAQTIENIAKHAAENPLNVRLPDKAKEAIRSLTEENGPHNVYVDPAAFSTYFQKAEDIAQFTDRVGLTAEYNEAIATGRDMEVPFDVYYVDMAATDMASVIQQFTKFAPEDMTATEAERFNVEWQEAQDQLRADYDASLAEDRTALEGEELVFEDVKTRAMNAGMVPDQATQYAKLYSNFFRVMAQRSGQDAGALYATYGLDIKRALPGEAAYKAVDNLDLALEAVRRGRIDPLRKRVEKASGPSLLQAIIARGGIVDADGELAGMDLPRGVVWAGEPVEAPRLEGVDDGAPAAMGEFNQYGADDTMRQMWEDGYFPEFSERPTANQLYDAIRAEASGERRYSATQSRSDDPGVEQARGLVQFADLLDAAGLDPATMTNDEIRAAIDEIVNADPDTAALYQGLQGPDPSDGVKRASIQFYRGPDGKTSTRTIINLFDQANLSSFLHESGHFFLEVFRDLAAQQQPVEVGPQSAIVEDWRKVQEYLGIGDDGVISTDAHEKFARTFEAYLFEGKAPSAEVASIMARFRSWLAFVYKSVAALRVPINDKIRGVMDRMIATDQEIAAARLGPEFRPAFRDAASAGMSEKQFADYSAAAGRAVERAKREMDTRMMQEISRETTAEWREAKREIRKEVIGQMEKRPVYQAIRYLRTGEAENAPAARLWLDRQSLLDMFGEGVLTKLPKGVPPLYRAKGGVHPDVIAELFGFKSGHDMVTQMMSVPNMGRAIAEETDIRMRQKYGDLMGDAVARARVAEEAIATDETGELLAAEIGVLVKKGLATSSVSTQQAKRIAREMIRSKTIREAVRTKLYMNANAKAAAEAERAIIAQDWPTALAAKKRQLLNHYMAMESRQAEKDVEAAVKYLNKFTGRKRVQGVWPTHLDQIETLLSRFDLRRSTSLKEEQRRTSLAKWLTEQEELGEVVAVPDAIRDDAFRKPYRQMTPDDLMGVRDAVRNIEHLGRRWAKVYGEIEAREHRGRVDELVASAAKSGPSQKKQKGQNPDEFEKFMGNTRSADGALLKMEQFFQLLDGGDINGPFRRLIWQRIADAEVAANDLHVEYTGKLLRVIEKLDPKRMQRVLTIPGLTRTMTGADVMAVALNMGNASNLQKMLKGETWTQAQADAVVSNLNADEARAVQEMWDVIGELWPKIEAVQTRMSGVVPPKIAASPVTIAGVQLQGGYFPMIYDPTRDYATEMRNAANADKVFENTYMKPDTWHGFAKERSEGYSAPVDFKMENVGKHIINVIHDTTHREAISDARKLIIDEQVRAAIVDKFGRERYNQMIPWLQAIANDRRQDDGLDVPRKIIRSVRSRASVMAMGLRYSTMITQVLGYSGSLEVVKPKHLAGAMKDFFGADGGLAIGAGAALGGATGGVMGAGLGASLAGGVYAAARSRMGGTSSMQAMSEEVYKLSGEMRHRKNQLDRDIRDNFRRLEGKTDWRADAERFGFAGIGYMDQAITVPTWMAAYRQHLAGQPTDQAGAIAFADQTIRLTQGAGGQKDLAAIMRDRGAMSLLTMFYSYFSTYYARQRKWGRDMRQKIATGEGSYSQLLARQVFLTIIPAVMADLILGRGPDDDDDESYPAWAAKKIAMYPFAAVPMLRDGINALGSNFGYTFTPAGRTVEEGIVQPFKMMVRMLDGEEDNNPEFREIVKQAIETTGYAARLPLGQVATTTDNVWKAIEQDDFQLRDLVLTRPKE